MAFREGKLFGNFIIIVNKCQDITGSDEDELENLKNSSPSLMKLIDQYFTSGPEIILLPILKWDYIDHPDFSEQGILSFYLNGIKLASRVFSGLRTHFVRTSTAKR